MTVNYYTLKGKEVGSANDILCACGRCRRELARREGELEYIDKAPDYEPCFICGEENAPIWARSDGDYLCAVWSEVN